MIQLSRDMLYRLSIHSCIFMGLLHHSLAGMRETSQLIVKVITLQHRTCNCTWFVTVCSWCDFAHRPTPPLPRPIWSMLDQRLWGTKSKYNSTNRDSYTFHSFHIPSKYLQWFRRTSCYLDINNNTPYFVFAVLKIHSFLKIYFIKILLPKH